MSGKSWRCRERPETNGESGGEARFDRQEQEMKLMTEILNMRSSNGKAHVDGRRTIYHARHEMVI